LKSARRRVLVRLLPALLLVPLALASCERRRLEHRLNVEERREWSSPGQRDTGRVCSDVGELRACFDAEPTPEWQMPLDASEAARCKNRVCLVPRPIPAPVLSDRGWRCIGFGPARRCFDRGRASGPFHCKNGRCVQERPTLPDGGEWICADAAGAALCAGSEPVAGLPPGPVDPGWLCRERRGGVSPRRVCLDLAPDFPDGRASGWRCHYEQEKGTKRVCERDEGAHVLGDTCDPRRPCVDGASCISGRCLPGAMEPNCWLDGDCSSKACRFGACVEPAT
jgi:hypothetical protein